MQRNITLVFLSAYDLSLRKIGMDLTVASGFGDWEEGARFWVAEDHALGWACPSGSVLGASGGLEPGLGTGGQLVLIFLLVPQSSLPQPLSPSSPPPVRPI